MARVSLTFIVLTFFTFFTIAYGAVNPVKREEAMEGACTETQPCGWAVYDKTSRVIDSYTKNKCTCPEGKKCMRDKDDISITAYVYRCKPDQKL